MSTTTKPVSSVVQLDGDTSWATEMDAVRAALADHYGTDVAGSALTPPRDPPACGRGCARPLRP